MLQATPGGCIDAGDRSTRFNWYPVTLVRLFIYAACLTDSGWAQSQPALQTPLVTELTVAAVRLVPPSVEFAAAEDFNPSQDRIACGLGTVMIPLDGLPTKTGDGSRYSVSLKIPPGTSTDARPRLWKIRRDALALLSTEWPSGVPQLSTIDSVGPGGEAAWVRAGKLSGIRVGSSWWRRVSGQPLMRLDVRFVAEELCFCRCVQLAAGARLNPGDAVELWPGSGEAREGRLRTAVSFIDVGKDDPFVWLPRISPRACPADARFDFYRDGKYVGFGVAERSDDRFWYARLLRQAGSQPLQVGDDAVVRTFQDAVAGRIRARVFARSKEGWLATAGEAEGIKPGHVGVVYRDRQPIGSVEVRRVQDAYCTTGDLLEPARSAGAPQPAERRSLHLLDEIRFGGEEKVGNRIGTIREIIPGGFVTVDVAAPALLNRALCIQSRDQIVGVAALFHAQESHAVGMIIEESLLANVQPGFELWSR